eukprot:gnl/MRDRNA2_/MRDRNA2_126836_c0_seq1.p1 gnl/MRDRNA2_/MRDRNA2_126836_c0~~gnl/MRDRNA2_/MRDRNA2_126836_c0_seq1.p1  ORF type:complete len:363 (+),score=69.23 gnl/MRDRNA2_/MRDRNA2_126836_c0_seq1:187-1275(+)
MRVLLVLVAEVGFFANCDELIDDKLIDRAVTAWSLHYVELQNTTLAKPCRTPLIPVPSSPFPICSGRKVPVLPASPEVRLRDTVIQASKAVAGAKQLDADDGGRGFDVMQQLEQYKSAFPHITSEQWTQLGSLSTGLLDWNQKINLISRKDEENFVSSHLIPCLAISLVRRFEAGEHVIDVGTGGGLPGLPMSIVNPEAHFTLLDSIGKKMMVVEDLVTKLGLSNVSVVRSRAEALTDRKFDFMLGRAVADIPTFLGFSSHLINDASVAPARPLVCTQGNGLDGKDLIGPGLLYLTGGDRGFELRQAGIAQSTQYNVEQLVPDLDSDKYVMHIKAEEILKFNARNSKIQKVNQKELKSRRGR